jgi:rSAM/selenodomain-associated transferase 2
VPLEPGRRLISIIVPVRNEASGVRLFLERLRQRSAGAEIIVVDGESSDGTAEIARPFCDQLIQTRCGRARQMNAGARVATGETFWFLHADVVVPRDCLSQIERQLANEEVVGGYFRIRLPRHRLVYRFTDRFAHYAGKVLRMRCSDHGFFCRREVFETIGGFPEVPLMEDVDFFRALSRLGRVYAVNSRLIVSPRRYELVGPVKLTLAYGLIATLYALGAPRRVLQAIYERTCCATLSEEPGPFHGCDWPSNVASRSRSS